jgi:hypothetical protein
VNFISTLKPKSGITICSTRSLSNPSVRRQFLVHRGGVLWYPCMKEKETMK